MNILVIAAHPDDEILGCGATMAKLADNGDEITVAILGEGITSRYASREEADPKELKALHAKCADALNCVGVKNYKLFDFPDNRFDSVPLLDIVKEIEKLINEVQPKIIFTHHGGDLNIDHVITHRAVMTATRPIEGCVVKELYAFEIASSTEWAFQDCGEDFKANTFIDVSKYIDNKIRAMECYESEARPFPHPRSEKALHAISAKWGSTVGVHSAEAFQLIRKIDSL